MIKKLRKTNGFTIVELLIATTVLTVVLVGASFVLVQVGRLYYKGTITAKTQSAGRNIVDSISRPIQLRGGAPSTPAEHPTVPSTYVVCVGNQRFTYQTQFQVGSGPNRRPHAVWRDTIQSQGECLTTAPNITNTTIASPGESMLSDGMRLFDLSITESPSGVDGIYVVSVRVGYGELDTFSTDPVTTEPDGCKGQISGGQFCAFVAYETSVNARIRQ